MCPLSLEVTKFASQVYLAWTHQLTDTPPPRFDLLSGVTGVKSSSVCIINRNWIIPAAWNGHEESDARNGQLEVKFITRWRVFGLKHYFTWVSNALGQRQATRLKHSHTNLCSMVDTLFFSDSQCIFPKVKQCWSLGTNWNTGTLIYVLWSMPPYLCLSQPQSRFILIQK